MEGLSELKEQWVPKLEKVVVESDKPYEWTKTEFEADGTGLVL